MSKAFDYIINLPLMEPSAPYEDMLGDVLFKGMRLATPEERKSLQNTVGKVLEILTADALGFEHLDIEGADVASDSHMVIAELKNRHNTLNHGGKQRIIRVMKDLTLSDKFRGYEKNLVIFHPKTAGMQKSLGQAVTEISAAKFFHRYGESFEDHYMNLVYRVADWYGVPKPEPSEYYREVVFPVRKKRRIRKG